MKKFVLVVLVAAMFVGIGIQNASAENSLKQGNISLGVTTTESPLIFAKYMLANDLSIGAGLGFRVHSGDNKSDADMTLAVGVRKYLKVADFAPFVGGVLAYDVQRDANDKTFALYAEGGAEYFLAKQFSLEGAVQLGYASISDKAADTTRGEFGTTRAAIGFNFYF